MSPIEKTRAKSDALRVLELDGSASIEDVKAAWRRIAFETHPDRQDGSIDAFVVAKSAYDFLTGAESDLEFLEAARSKRREAAGNSGARPRVVTRILKFSTDALSECQELLTEKPSVTDQSDHDGDVATAGETKNTTDHVPNAVRRRGRCLTFLVGTPLGEGTNRAALPTGVLENNRKLKPKIVTFNSGGTGSGAIEIPEKLRSSLFPGARSVRISFAQ